MTLRSMAATQATTTITLNPSADKKQAVGRNTKWKLGEPAPTLLRQRIPELDGIRGVAIGLVLLWHFVFGGMEAAAPGTFWSYFKAAGRLTWSGVDLFFVLSGFLIGGILLDTRDSPNYFRTFYTRRFFRIVPLYLAVLCVALAGNRGSIDPQIPTFSYFAFLQNFWMARFATLGVLLAPTWSLAVEEQFYLTLPSIVRFVGRRHLGYVLAAGILAAPGLRMLCLHLWPANEIAPYVLMPCRADALLLGAIGALAIRNARAARWMKDNGGTMFALLMLFAAGALVLTKYSPTHRFAVTSVGYSWLASLYLCAILCVVTHPETWLARWMRTLWLGWLGLIAYGVYLVHQMAAIGIFRILGHFEYFYLRRPANAVALCIALLVTLALCSLSWRYFEKPLVQFGHRSAKSIAHSENTPALKTSP